FNDGSIDYTISGGSPGYTFAWDNGGVTEDINTLVAGTYNVTVTDINGCVIDTTITLIEPTPLGTALDPSVYAGGWNTSGCANDGTIDLTINGGSGGYTIDWSNDGVGDFNDPEDINNLFPGWYFVDVLDMNGCLIEDSIQLLAPPTLNTSISVTSDYNGEDVSCQGASDGSVEVIALDGTPGYTYQWQNANGTIISNVFDPSGVPAGWYWVLTVDQNGCSSYDSIEVIDAPPIIVDILISSDYNGQDISCFGASDGNIDFIPVGGTPGYTIQWTDDQGNPVGNNEDLLGQPLGTYYVSLVDANGCQADTFITLTQPPLLTGVTSVITDYNGQDISCFGYSDGGVDVVPNGGTPGYSYQWTNQAGGTVGMADVVNGLPTGTYDVLITDVNGCTFTTNIFVDEPTAVTAGINILSDYFGLPISCADQNDGSIQAIPGGGTPGYTYSWDTSPAQSTQILNNLGEGTYTVTIEDLNGCQDTSIVTLIGNPLPILTPDPAMNACEGYTVTFGSNSLPDESCVWQLSNGMTIYDCGPNTLLLDPGCYEATLTVTSPLGCAADTVIPDYICVYENPVADFTANPFVGTVLENDIHFTNLSWNATYYSWNFGDGQLSNEENPMHFYPSVNTGTYEVLLIAYSPEGCVDSVRKEVQILKEAIFYVPNTFTPDGDPHNQIFNPVFGMGIQTRDYGFYIFNRWGELIFESHDPSRGWDGTYGTGTDFQCQDGTYTWKLVLRTDEDVIGGSVKKVFHGHVNLIR
ncbi:MAG: hypothetical protein EP333_10385, partial [Bacteroidetes bacterium]